MGRLQNITIVLAGIMTTLKPTMQCDCLTSKLESTTSIRVMVLFPTRPPVLRFEMAPVVSRTMSSVWRLVMVMSTESTVPEKTPHPEPATVQKKSDSVMLKSDSSIWEGVNNENNK